MGRITIGNASVKLEDRVIAHLELVIVTKLRRGESFIFTWSHDVSLGGGRESKWVYPDADVDFRFDSRVRTTINAAWVEALMSSANSPTGLRIVPEPDPATEVDPIAAAMWPASTI